MSKSQDRLDARRAIQERAIARRREREHQDERIAKLALDVSQPRAARGAAGPRWRRTDCRPGVDSHDQDRGALCDRSDRVGGRLTTHGARGRALARRCRGVVRVMTWLYRGRCPTPRGLVAVTDPAGRVDTPGTNTRCDTQGADRVGSSGLCLEPRLHRVPHEGSRRARSRRQLFGW
jgi:hypothetical protein